MAHRTCRCSRNPLPVFVRTGQSPETSLDGNGSNGDGEDSEPIVAIKQFKGLTDMEDEHTRDYVRLTQEREADLARSLIHPNIVRCLGTLTAGGADASSEGGNGDGVAFLIFEHVPGTLLDLIQERPGGLSLPEVRGVFLFFLFCRGHAWGPRRARSDAATATSVLLLPCFFPIWKKLSRPRTGGASRTSRPVVPRLPACTKPPNRRWPGVMVPLRRSTNP